MVLLGVCAVESWVFVWLYSRVAWAKSNEGRHLMRFTAILGLTFTLNLHLPAGAAGPTLGCDHLAGPLHRDRPGAWNRLYLMRRAQQLAKKSGHAVGTQKERGPIRGL